MKKMRYFNGRCPDIFRGSHTHLNICAFTKAAAVRLGQKAFVLFSMHELNEYFSECWGTKAQEVLGDQTDEGLFLEINDRFFKFMG